MRLLASFFQTSNSEEIPTFPPLLAPPWSNFIVHKNTDSSFFFFCQAELVTPIRNCSVDTELIDRVNCLEQEFCIFKTSIEVNGTSASLLLQDSTTQSTGTFEDRMTSVFESLYHLVGSAIPLPFLIVGIAVPLLFRPWTRNVQCPDKKFRA